MSADISRNDNASHTDDAIADEQPAITRLYEQLDLLRERTTARLADLYRQRGSTPQAVWDREAFVARDVERLHRLGSVDRGLCFGRLDFTGQQTSYIGRMGLSDDNYEQLLVDWRAPAAEPFYRATAADPGELVRRRHIQTRHRKVIAVDDEVFRFDAVPNGARGGLRGEAALLASLDAHRTGRMSDIVATIQAEQDRIIRSPLAGALVVQGGPGTGKTVAALHRAAYLLYTYRDRLAKSGVLIIGPNRTFLRYIDQVLPSLGETGVVLTTLGELFPGVNAIAPESSEAAAVKGDLRMAEVIKAAVSDRQRVPSASVAVVIDGLELVLDVATVRRARTRARRSNKPHNIARAVFLREVLGELARQQARASGDSVDDEDLAEMRADLLAEAPIQALMDELWPALTPHRLIDELLSETARLTTAAAALSDAERGVVQRAAGAAWTVDDVPLLDEAAELLGEIDDPGEAARQAKLREEAEVRFAQRLLEELQLEVPVDPALVAERYRAAPVRQTVVERAAADRGWAFGHVIVDEAQELSPMAWRMIMRRGPGRSMTIVGDIAQTGSAAGASGWEEVLDAHVPGRWRQETLTVNYRTPAEVMEVAADVLASIDPALTAPSSVRSTGVRPWTLAVPQEQLPATLTEVVTDELEVLGAGRMGVVVPRSMLTEAYDALEKAMPGAVRQAGDATALDAPVALLTPGQAKGLEFDTVLVVEPSSILAESVRGATDLYVSVTRTTQRLGVIHSFPLPAELKNMAEHRVKPPAASPVDRGSRPQRGFGGP